MSKDIEIVQGEVLPYQDWMDALPLVKSSDDVAVEMTTSILKASTIDDVLELNETIGLKELLGQVLVLHSAELRESNLEAGYPVYAVIDCESETTGKRMTVTSGSSKILAQLCKFQMMGAYPIRVKAIGIESNSHKGRVSIQFVKPDEF